MQEGNASCNLSIEVILKSETLTSSPKVRRRLTASHTRALAVRATAARYVKAHKEGESQDIFKLSCSNFIATGYNMTSRTQHPA